MTAIFQRNHHVDKDSEYSAPQIKLKSSKLSRISSTRFIAMTVCLTGLITSGCENFSSLHDQGYSIKEPLSPNHTPPTAEQTATDSAKQDAAAKLLSVESLLAIEALKAKQKKAKENQSKTAWQAIYEQPGLKEQRNARIAEQKEWYLTHPAFLSKVLARSEPFLGYVVQEAKRRKMPLAIALLPIVESRYNPHAISKAGAVGTWQFMPATAAHFGLKMNWWYDGRRDIITSTDAALTYLDQLQGRFDGDWLLALASYNVGAGNVNKAIRRNKAKGLPTDYWSLKLPRETSQYVPRLLALLEIIEDSKSYGVQLPPIDQKSQVAHVHTRGQIDIAKAAQLAGISETHFRTLNPGLRRWASDPEGPFTVLVPSDRAQKLKRGLLALPAHKKLSWHQHTVKPGDTISEIANTYQVPTTEFKRINQLSSSFIRVGQSLLVPKQAQLVKLGSKKAKVARLNSVDHKVKPGDTLWDISRHYKTSLRTIAAENNIPTRAPLRVGKVLTISLSKAGSQRVNYKVKAGDSLYGIAKQFKVSIGEIASWNALDKQRHIRPGQELTLFLIDES